MAETPPKRMKLTKLGDLVNRHSVYAIVPFIWWRSIFNTVNRKTDEGYEPEELFNELIDGLMEMRDRWYELVNSR